MSGFSIPGLGSGIDWSRYITSVRAAEEGAVARTLGRKQAVVAAQTTVFGQVRGLIQGLKNTVDAFSSTSDFKVKSVSSSDSDIVSATATLSAVNGPTTIRVDQLATNEEWHFQHSGVDNSVSANPTTFTITIRGVETTLNIGAGTTLKQFAEQLNAANLGITAQVFDLGDGSASPARLSIRDNKTGKFNADQTPDTNFNIVIGALSGDLTTAGLSVKDGNVGVGGDQPITEGKDSKFYLNGNTTDAVYRDNNVITDVIPGMTINLKGVDAANFKTLNVVESLGQTKTKIQALLEDYNVVIVNLRKAIRYDPDQEVQSNPTAGDGTLRTILSQLQSAFTGTVSTIPESSSIRTLADLGVKRMVSANSQGGDGQLELNDAKLNEAIDNHYEDVVDFFQGGTLTGSSEKFDGFVKRLQDSLDSMISPTKGSLTGKVDSLNEQGKRLIDEITQKVERINLKEQRLKDKFARLESQLSGLNGQQSQLQSALNSIALNNQAISRR